MHMPREKPAALQRNMLADEVRLCFLAAAACTTAGLLGWAIEAVARFKSHFSALLVVGVFYGVMGVARWWKLNRSKPSDTAGH